MDLAGNYPRVARKKFWCWFLKCTMRYEVHLVTASAKRFQKSPAKCQLFPAIIYLLCRAFHRHVWAQKVLISTICAPQIAQKHLWKNTFLILV